MTEIWFILSIISPSAWTIAGLNLRMDEGII